MIYFAYGSNLLTHRLEKRVGQVGVIGPGKLFGYRFAIDKISKKDGSLKADALYTGNQQDFVIGVLFRINPAAKERLDKEEGLGKGYNEKAVKVETSTVGETENAFTYVASSPDLTGKNKAYDWYMNIIVAGAGEHQLDAAYIQFLKSIPTKPDSDPTRNLQAEIIITQSMLTKKEFIPTIELMHTINRASEYIVELPGHFLDGKTLHLRKNKTEFTFQTEAEAFMGFEDHKDLNLTGYTIRLVNNDISWTIEGKYFLVSHIQYNEKNGRILTGTIASICSVNFNAKAKTYYRFIVPIPARLRNNMDYESSGYRTTSGIAGGLLTVKISGEIFQFYNAKIGENFLLFIDGCSKTTLEEFQKVCNSILLTYAFLSGPYHAGQGYFFAFDDAEHRVPTGIVFHSLNTVEDDSYSIFTTNPFIGVDEKTLQRDGKGVLTPEASKKLYEGIKYFPVDVFSRICELTFTNEKLLRTLILLINNRSTTLEMKIPLQYVTLETITAVISKGGNKELKPLEDKDEEELLAEINKSIEEFSRRKGINQDMKNYLFKKVKHINSPANLDKLSKSFGLVGYALSSEEKKAIKQRDPYLHGSIRSLIGRKVDSKELFHLSLRLHFLIAVLLLKYAGFSGKIINHAKLYSHISGKEINEEVLRAI